MRPKVLRYPSQVWLGACWAIRGTVRDPLRIAVGVQSKEAYLIWSAIIH